LPAGRGRQRVQQVAETAPGDIQPMAVLQHHFPRTAGHRHYFRDGDLLSWRLQRRRRYRLADFARLFSIRVDARDYVTGRGLGGVLGRNHFLPMLGVVFRP